MTYKYFNVRKEISNDSSEKELKRFRTFSEIKQLFKPFHWTIFILTIISIVALVILLVVSINKLWCIIPALLIIICVKIWDAKAEELYDVKMHEKEIKGLDNAYDEYLSNINRILVDNGIDTAEKRNCLKKECCSVFERRDSKYSSLSNKAFEILIGIPIGAVISLLVNGDSVVSVEQIIAVVIACVMIYVIIKFAKFITYYTDGCKQDQKLLDALNEMEYYSGRNDKSKSKDN